MDLFVVEFDNNYSKNHPNSAIHKQFSIMALVQFMGEGRETLIIIMHLRIYV